MRAAAASRLILFRGAARDDAGPTRRRSRRTCRGRHARWRRRGAEVHAGDSRAVRVEGHAGTHRQLEGGVRPGDDVPADVVGVVVLEGGRMGGRPCRGHVHGTPGRTARSARRSPRSRRRRSRAARVRRSRPGVGRPSSAPDRPGTAGRRGRRAAPACAPPGSSARSRRPPRTSRRGGRCCSAGRLAGPRDAALDREVGLEGSGPVAETAVGPRDPPRQPVAEDVGDRAGARSKRTTSAGGRSAGERTRTPVSIRPPNSVSCAASASLMAREPPAATGQPCR